MCSTKGTDHMNELMNFKLIDSLNYQLFTVKNNLALTLPVSVVQSNQGRK